MRYVIALFMIASLNAHTASAQTPRTAALQKALRNLVVAQEQYFVAHGTYTTDVAALGMFHRASAPDSIWVQVINAGGRSWNGRAIHAAARDKSCVIYVGYKTDLPSAPVTDTDSVPATKEGLPVCDRM